MTQPQRRARRQPPPSPFVIDIQADPELESQLELAVLQATALAALNYPHPGEHPASGELTIVITDDAVVRDLNRRYRGVDQATDVLSFPADEPGTFFLAPENPLAYLGDVVIAYPQAAAQARAAGHSPQAELQLLVVHGVLHLLGYDHPDDAERARMWQIQAAILTAVGAPVTLPSPASLADHDA